MINSYEEYNKMIEESKANNAQKGQASTSYPYAPDQNNYNKIKIFKNNAVSESSSSIYISTGVDSGNKSVIVKVSPSVVKERFARLNDVEKQVFRMYRQGVQTAKIAYDLGVSRSTVNRALQDLKIKLGINSANKDEILYKAHYEMGFPLSNEVKARIDDWVFRKRQVRQNPKPIQPTVKEPKNYYYPGM